MTTGGGGILLFSGGADYADPWHPFAETSAIVADVLRDEGDVTVVDTLDDLAERIDAADMLVVNAGGGTAPHPLDARLAEILAAYGGPLLALHVAATLLPEHTVWEARLGGRWVRDETYHPERGPLHVRAVSASVADLDPLDTVDEAYTALRVSPEADVLLVHDHADGVAHPLAWTHESNGCRAAYSALGHDAEAYAPPLAPELIRRLSRWLLT
ncbi:ThuA domain-containing protein [Microbacterium sp. KSW-18]|uniref:ThuA domain-containing protein n=1 Tax=Microbacterium aquilitoris TaxID=3067307 RepID=A0ABU3GGS2_9MICO|nr:ThuA domain-containing protein [Microbacterium sp. KSW-18]MDT3329905.1 ThuA domain-containing protein [Microbacterium sp. KSW-18]